MLYADESHTQAQSSTPQVKAPKRAQPDEIPGAADLTKSLATPHNCHKGLEGKENSNSGLESAGRKLQPPFTGRERIEQVPCGTVVFPFRKLDAMCGFQRELCLCHPSGVITCRNACIDFWVRLRFMQMSPDAECCLSLQAWHLARVQRQHLLHKRAELKRWPEPEQPQLGVPHPAFIGCKTCIRCSRTWPLRFFPKKPTSRDGYALSNTIRPSLCLHP